ncbi:cobalamin-dependent protein [bacterium]|nr:cobalamin-dependent protein [bacterium]
MEKKVLLCNPKPAYLSIKKGVLPLSLLAISTLLDMDGYKIIIINYDDENKKEKLLHNCEDSICVGITSMTGYQIKDGLNMARLIKDHNPNARIVFGGWHPTILSEQTLKNPYVDIVVKGQGERTFYNLVKALGTDGDLTLIEGICYKNNGRIICNKNAPIEDPNTFPRLPFHLIDVNSYASISEYGKRTINYITSIGCPFRCGFCVEPNVYKRRWKPLSVERVLNDIEFLRDTYDIDSIMINDSNFFVDEQRVKKISSGIKKLGIKWGKVNGRADQLSRFSEETWELLSESNLHSILVGTESCRQEDLDIIGKDAKVEDTYRLIEIAKKFNVALELSLMIGLPKKRRTRTLKQELYDMIDDILKLNNISSNNYYLLFIYTPYPGNPLYDKSVSIGFQAPESLEEWSNFELYYANTPWVDKEVGKLVVQVNYYLRFVSKKVHKIIMQIRFPLNYIFLPAEYCITKLALLRLKKKFFALPVEFFVMEKIVEFYNRKTNKMS